MGGLAGERWPLQGGLVALSSGKNSCLAAPIKGAMTPVARKTWTPFSSEFFASVMFFEEPKLPQRNDKTDAMHPLCYMTYLWVLN